LNRRKSGDARYAAEDRHARRVRQIIRDEYSDKITYDEANYGVDATDPQAAFTTAPDQITATWLRVQEFERFSEPPKRVEERILMMLVKKPNP
jgi:hypothetical protein